jgi:Mu-like prophage protein gpG
MVQVQVEGDTRELVSTMKNLSEVDKKKLNAILGQDVRNSTLDRFKQSKGPNGRRWRTSIRAGAEGGKTLIQTSQLRNSIQVKSDASGFAVGTNVVHAATHQFGDTRTIRAKTNKGLRFKVGGRWVKKTSVTVTIPARPFLGMNDDDMSTLKNTAEAFIMKES